MMSAATMTSARQANARERAATQTSAVFPRVRRALFLGGNLGLMLGSLLGLLRARPELLLPWLPVSVSDLGLMLSGGTLIGLMVGAATGLALRGSRSLLRFSSAAFVTTAALIASEFVRAVGLLLPLQSALTGESSAALAAQLALALAGSLAGIQAGRQNIQGQTASASRPAARPSRRAAARQATARRARAANAQTASDGAAGRVQLVVPQPAPRPAFKKRRFRRLVHLGREKTNVCPYCLEEVRPGDPRGRVVCKICGTPHHGDCWAITGKCEVPHLQT